MHSRPSARTLSVTVPLFALLTLLSFIVVPTATAQTSFTITGYAGFQFWGSFDGVAADGAPSEFRIDDAGNWGGAFAARVEPNILFEFSYLNQKTKLKARNNTTGVTSDVFDMTVHYIQAGTMYEALGQGKHITPYGGISIGVAILDPAGEAMRTEWRLAFGLNGGVKIYFSENIGLRGQGSLLIPIQWGRGELFCGNGTCPVSVDSWFAALQGSVTGGLFVEF